MTRIQRRKSVPYTSVMTNCRPLNSSTSCCRTGSERSHRCCYLLNNFGSHLSNLHNGQSLGDPGSHITYGSLGLPKSTSRTHLARFGRFSTTHGYDQQPDTDSTPHPQQWAAFFHSVHAMRPDNKSYCYGHSIRSSIALPVRNCKQHN